MNKLLNLGSAVVGALLFWIISESFFSNADDDMSGEIEIHELSENQFEQVSSGGFVLEGSAFSESTVAFRAEDYLGNSITNYTNATPVEGVPFLVPIGDYNAVFLVEDGKIVNFIRFSEEP